MTLPPERADVSEAPDDGDGAGDGDDEQIRVWLVERQYDDGGMVTLVYATPDGRRRYRTQFSAAYLDARSVTAARTVAAADLETTPDGERERYRQEVDRVSGRHDPDDEV